MIPLTVTTNLEIDPWTDLNRDEVTGGTIERIGVLPNGTKQGRACVELLIRTKDGQLVIAETTLKLFHFASHAVLATPIAEMEDL